MKKFGCLVFASAFIFTFFNLFNTESANSYESHQTRIDNRDANTEFGDSYGIFFSRAVFIGDREERDRHLPPGTFTGYLRNSTQTTFAEVQIKITTRFPNSYTPSPPSVYTTVKDLNPGEKKSFTVRFENEEALKNRDFVENGDIEIIKVIRK
jgi:hypothetical protein